MRKRSKRLVWFLAIAVVAAFVCWIIGTGAVLAFLMLLGLWVIIAFFARVYPSNRAREDQAEREDSF